MAEMAGEFDIRTRVQPHTDMLVPRFWVVASAGGWARGARVGRGEDRGLGGGSLPGVLLSPHVPAGSRLEQPLGRETESLKAGVVAAPRMALSEEP